MRKWLRRIGFLVLSLLVVAALAMTWLLFFQGRAPAKRPDLANVPVDVPPPARAYPTQNALIAAYLLGWVELIDPLADGILGGDMDDLLAKAPVPPEVIARRDIPYSDATSPPLMLDLFYPGNLDKPVPGLILIHGGGWSSGQRSDYTYYGVEFAKAGYVVASISYRLRGAAPFPAAVEDAKCAVRWMRANAEVLRVDPERIAVAGGSAGGHLSMMVGYAPEVEAWNSTGGYPGVSSAVAAVVNLYGPTDLTTGIGQESPIVSAFLGASYAEQPELYTLASPLHHLDASDPPTLTIHGTLDSIVPVEQADLLAERFQAMGKDYWYDRIDGWIHTLDISKQNSARSIALMKAFFEETMGPAPPPAAPVSMPHHRMEGLTGPSATAKTAHPVEAAVARALETAPPPPPRYATTAELQAAMAEGRHELLTGADVVIAEGVVVERDIVYNDAGMALDLYRPGAAAAPLPAIVFIHGGAWEGGDKQYYSYWAARYAAMGYVCAAVQYRFAQQAPFPAALDDCRDAVRWLTARAAELRINPARIGVVGQSAGGHLALMVALAAADGVDVAAVSAFYPPVNLAAEDMRGHDAVKNFLGSAYEENEQLYQGASPIHHVDPSDPPVLLLHGTIDSVVPFAQSEAMADRLDQAGVPRALVALDGWDHAFEVVKEVNTYCMHVQDAFLEACLR
jgi:acetyl esterase/lipase